MKNEKPVKPSTLDRQLQRREANAQKKPWPLSQISRFDKGLNRTTSSLPKRKV